MVKMYKLVTQEYTTHGGMKWKIGKTNRATGNGSSMCSNQVLHCYASPEQAVLLNSIHAAIPNPILLEIECSPIVNTDGLKFACKEQTPTKVVPLPCLTTIQHIGIAIKLALRLYTNPAFVKWAGEWLSGVDRTADSARVAADAAYAVAYDARAAAYAAYAARAYAAAYAAAAAYDAAYDAAYAARAAAYAAHVAARAATSGTTLQEIIVWCMDSIN